MKTLTYILLAGLLTFSSIGFIQDSQNQGSCPKIGQTKKGGKPTPSKQHLNLNKNRDTDPAVNDFDNTVTLEKIMNSGDDPSKFNDSKAATVTGYILKAKDEGPESCNCYSQNAPDYDIHVYIAPTDPKQIGECAVVELTPWTKKQHPEWTSDYINANLAHHKVTVTGWLLYDIEHTGVSYQTHPELTTKKAQRFTVWEIHPITNLEISQN